MNKIAIQLAGQVRYWKKSYNDWVNFKSNLEKEGFDVDFHICTWEDEYTNECNFDFFETTNLVPINTEMVFKNVIRDRKKNILKDTERRNQVPFDMIPYTYLQYFGSRFRRLYQIKNTLEYDFIILVRPDAHYTDNEYLNFSKQLSKNWNLYSRSNFTIFIPLGISNSSGFKPEFPTRFSHDVLFGGTEESINLFCNGFLYCYLQTSQSFYSTNHTIPAMICMKTNLHDKTMKDVGNPLIRSYRRND